MTVAAVTGDGPWDGWEPTSMACAHDRCARCPARAANPGGRNCHCVCHRPGHAEHPTAPAAGGPA